MQGTLGQQLPLFEQAAAAASALAVDPGAGFSPQQALVPDVRDACDMLSAFHIKE